MCCAALRLRISIAHLRDVNNAVGRAPAALAHVAAWDCCDTVEIEVDPRSECYYLSTWYMVQVGLNAGRGGGAVQLYSGEVSEEGGKTVPRSECYMLHVTC